MMSDVLTRQRKQLNDIWQHGTPAEREEVREILSALAQEMKLAIPLADPREATTLSPSIECVACIHHSGTEMQKKLVADLLDDLADRIRASRHRDITLI